MRELARRRGVRVSPHATRAVTSRPRARMAVERGVATTELAIAALLLVPVTSGVIDGGFYMQAKRLNADATRAAGREGARACVGSTNCTGSNPTNADTRMVTAAAAVYGSRSPNIRRVVVWRASASSDAVPGSCLTSTTGGVAGLCNVYTNPVNSSGAVAITEGSYWASTSRVRSMSTADYLGIFVEFQQTNPVGLVMPKSVKITSRAVFRLEPPVIAQTAVPDLPTFPQAPFGWTWEDWTTPCTSDCGGGSSSPVSPGNGAG